MIHRSSSLKKHTLSLAIAVCACALLSACGTTSSQSHHNSDVSAAIQRANDNVAKRTGATGSLKNLERKYKRNAEDPQIATGYARALRENDYLSRAEIVLAPFATDAASPAYTKSEYAAIQLAQGKYAAAEKYAQKAVTQDDKNHQAYHLLGIALDAQGQHEEAERAFRIALDHWQGDPTSVMNNLALNLTSQSYLDEAVKILLEAQAISPRKVEVERNLRIVRALQQSTGPKAPKPKAKPDQNG